MLILNDSDATFGFCFLRRKQSEIRFYLIDKKPILGLYFTWRIKVKIAYEIHVDSMIKMFRLMD